ncbi:MAG: hypothetical protein CFE21_10085 [Bacteroidetes bacterium B1(2017)]|nr:MAG: hypothetical protein CFE21_10085 [Bacteroidetes bacterium B1(2017)]
MKKLMTAILMLCSIGITLSLKAQCILDAGTDATIICGETVPLNAESNWQLLSSGTSKHLSALYFTSSTTGYFAGDSGIVLKTINQGNSFSTLNTGTYVNLRSIKFIGSNLGFSVGEQGTILKTTNAGANFASLTSGTTNNLEDVFFTSATIGYAVGYAGTVLKTIDGGSTWTSLSTGYSYNFNTVFFTDSLTGFVGGYGGGILKTTNGGATWTQQFYFNYCNITSIWFNTATTGYASGVAGSGFILKTTDAGATWVNLPYSAAYGKLFFSTPTTGYIASGNIYKTNNGFTTLKQAPNAPFIGTRAIFFPSETVGFTAGFGGAIYRQWAPDSVRWWPALGLSDSTLSNPIARPAESTNYFVSAKVNGCILTSNVTITVNPLTLNAGKIKSVTCGDTTHLNAIVNYTGSIPLSFKWSPSTGLNNDTLQNPYCVLYSNAIYIAKATSSNGCVASDTLTIYQNFSVKVGSDRSIYCSKETQLSIQVEWIKGNSGTLETLKSIYFTSTDTGFASSSNSLFTTYNAGITWNAKSFGANYLVNKVFFRNSQIGFASAFNSLSMSGTVLKTTNGGNTWSAQTLGGNYNVPAIWFTNDYTGYAIANPGKILRTLNGGSSWLIVNTGSSYALNNIYFTSTTTGYAVGTMGTILKTTNAGLSWSPQSSGVTNELTAIYFISADTGYVVGNTNTFLKTTNGGATWTSIPVNTSTLVWYNLNDVYFTNANIGYAASSYTWMYGIQNPSGTIFKTTNAGATWERMYADSSYPIYAIYFNASGQGFAGGGNGALFNSPLPADNYTWAPAYGLSSSTSSNPIAKPTHTTTYIVTGNKGNCSLQDTITVSVLNLPIDAGNEQKVVCGDIPKLVPNNVYVEIDAARYGSTWSIKDSSNKTILSSIADSIYRGYMYLPDGNYTYIGYPQVIPPPQRIRIIPFASNDSISEFNLAPMGSPVTRSFKITTQPHYTFTYTPTPSSINPTSTSSKYYLSMTTTDGCLSKDSVVVVPSALKVNAGSNKSIICGALVALDTLKTNYTGSASLQVFYWPGKTLSDSLSYWPKANPITSTNYIVFASTQNGCFAADTLEVLVNPLSIHGMPLLVTCNKLDTLKTTSNYTGNTPLTYTWSPSINLDSVHKAAPIVHALNQVKYEVKIETSNGCIAKDSIEVTLENPAPEPICMVGVTVNNFNELIITKRNNPTLDSIFISKETNTTGNYQRIGSLSYTQSLVFVDSNANPMVQSNKYVLNLKDICGLVSNQSAAHKTMHLTINKGTGTIWNLIWSAYEGFTVATYNIYRGTDSSNLSLIGTSSGSNSSYTDLSAPSGDFFYQVEIINPNACDPGKTYNSSKSNKANTKTTGLFEPSAYNNWIKLFPNPAQNQVEIEIANNSQAIQLFVLSIEGKLLLNQEGAQTKLDISSLAPGVYYLGVRTSNQIGFRMFVKY